MKKLNRMVALSILAALVLAAVAIVPARADPPEIWTGPSEWSGVYDCGDFDLVYGWTGWERFIIHWDILQGTYQAHTRMFIYRLDDPENVIETASNNWLENYRLEKDPWVMRLGTWDNWVLPGIGHIWFEAGRATWDSEGNLTLQGRSMYAGDVDDACPLFAK